MGSPATPYLQVTEGLRDLLLEFWDPLHPERLKLETSNLARRLTTWGSVFFFSFGVAVNAEAGMTIHSQS